MKPATNEPASEFALAGAVSRQRLFGAGVLGTPGGSGQRLRHEVVISCGAVVIARHLT